MKQLDSFSLKDKTTEVYYALRDFLTTRLICFGDSFAAFIAGFENQNIELNRASKLDGKKF